MTAAETEQDVAAHPARVRTKKRSCILVLGMHRSGTSAITRVMSLLGCQLPKNLMPSSKSNPGGHWESSAVYKLNNRILASAGSSWDDWQGVNPDWFDSLEAEDFHDEAVAVLKEEFAEARLFVLKDPRICRLLPFWRSVLASVNVDPLVVLPFRNPLEVSGSLATRNSFHQSFSHLIWLRQI